MRDRDRAIRKAQQRPAARGDPDHPRLAPRRRQEMIEIDRRRRCADPDVDVRSRILGLTDALQHFQVSKVLTTICRSRRLAPADIDDIHDWLPELADL